MSKLKPARRRLIEPFLLMLAAISLVQCVSPVPPGHQISSLAEVQGQWDIVVFNGYRPPRLDGDGQRHAFVDVLSDSMSFTIGCNFSGMTARIDETGRLLETSEGESVDTTMGCGRERQQQEAEFFAFFRSEPGVVRLADGSLKMESRTGTLLAQRPGIRRQAQLPASLRDIAGDWKADILYYETQPGGSRNLLAPLDGGRADLALSGDSITLRFDCEVVQQKLEHLAPGELRAGPGASDRRTALPCRIGQADRELIASLVTGAISVERIDSERLHLVAGNVRAVAIREPR